MTFLDMNYCYVCEGEESVDPYANMRVAVNGDYLCVQWSEHPVHVYRRVRQGESVHRFTDQMEHAGHRYQLAWIEDEKEHATAY